MPPKTLDFSKKACAERRAAKEKADEEIRLKLAAEKAALEVASKKAYLEVAAKEDAKMTEIEKIEALKKKLYLTGGFLSRQNKKLPKYLESQDAKLEIIEEKYHSNFVSIEREIAYVSTRLEETQNAIAKLKSKEIPTEEEIDVEKKANEAKYVEQLAQQEAEMPLLKHKFEEERNEKMRIIQSQLASLYGDSNQEWIKFVTEAIDFHKKNGHYPNGDIDYVTSKFGLPYACNDYLRGCPKDFIGVGQSKEQHTLGVIGYFLTNPDYRYRSRIEEYMFRKEIERKSIEAKIRTLETLVFNPPVISMPISKLETERKNIMDWIQIYEKEIRFRSSYLETKKIDFQELKMKLESEKQVIQEEKKSRIDEIERIKNEWLEMKRQLAELTAH